MKVVINKRPKKYISNLNKADQKRIMEAIARLGLEPPEGDIVKMTDKDNEYRLRVGELRLLYTIEKSITDNGSTENYIAVYKIAPRGQIYKE